MDKKTIAIGVLVIIGIVGLMWWGRGSQAAPPSQSQLNTKSQLSASEVLYDFGTISMASGNVTHIFKVTNPTSAEVIIPDVTTSCMCTLAYVVGPDGSKKGPFGMPGMGAATPKALEVIKAGEARDIEVVYDPNAHGPAGVGQIDRQIYLRDSAGGVLTLEIKANVTP